MAIYEESTTSGTSGLIDYLNNERQIDQKCIEMLKKEHIDESTLPMMSDEDLTAYLPLKGDRLAARWFCSNKTCDKRSLLDRLRGQFSKNGIDTNRINRGRGNGNENAAKAFRTVEIGWMDYCHSTGSYKQVRSQKGGGTRVVKFAKTDNALDVLDKCKDLFFPNGVCKKGAVSNFSFKVCDFKQSEVDDKTTIANLYSVCHMRTLRLYICSKKNGSDSSVNELPTIQKLKKRKSSNTSLGEIQGREKYVDGIPESKTRDKERATATCSYTELKNCETVEGNLPDMYMHNIDIVAMAAASAKVSPESDLQMTDLHYQDSDISFDIPFYDAEETVTASDVCTSTKFAWSSQLLKGPIETVPDGDTQAHQPAVQGEPHTSDAQQTPVQLGDPECLNQTSQPLEGASGPAALAGNLSFTAPTVTPQPSIDMIDSELMNTEYNEYIDSQLMDNEYKEYSVQMNIHRGPLGFQEVIGYFKDENILQKPLSVSRILPNGERELAEDSGGVLRDLLTEFWTSFYETCTMGREAKVPSLRHDFGAIEWESVARVLVYGYTRMGYWPVMLAKSFVLQCINPEAEVDNQCLLTDFYKFVSQQDKEVFQQAFEKFSSVSTDEHLDSLDMYECKLLPCADNIKSTLFEIAHTHIIQKPMFVCNSMKNVLSEMHLTKTKVNEIYERIVPSNRKVVQILHFPEQMNTTQLEVSKHLKRYIRDLDKEKLKLFLRYCTGSDLLTTEKISVDFTLMNGLERRPIAHTCSCLLELSQTYESYMEFRSEFDNILSHNVWLMDII